MIFKKSSKIVKNGDFINKSIKIFAIFSISSFLLLFFYFPLIKLFDFSILQDGISFKNILNTLSHPLNQSSIIYSFNQAIVSTLLCLIFGLPVSYFLAIYKFRGKKLLINFLTIPFILPPIVVLLGFIIVFGENSWINQIFGLISNSNSPIFKLFGTYEGILVAHVFYNISVIIRMTIPAWQNIDRDLINVGKTLGASRWKVFKSLIFPQIKNYIISAALMVFTYCFNSFAIVLYLGEVKFQTIEVRVYKLMKYSLDFSSGASLAIIQLIINTLIIIIYLNFEKKSRKMALKKEKQFTCKKIRFSRNNFKESLFLFILILFTIITSLFSFSPIFAVVLLSFKPYSHGISPFWGYRELFSVQKNSLLGASPLKILFNTIFFAVSTTLITLVFSLMIVFVIKNKYNKFKKYQNSRTESIISTIIILPMAISSISLAMGLFLQFRNSSIYISATWILIIFAHVLICIPFATRSILSSYNRIDLELLNIASTLGASRLKIFWKIEFPLIQKGLIIGGIFSFAISLGEFGATNFLARAEYNTISIGISKLIFSRTLQLPASMASLLILLSIICFLIIHKIGEIELKV